MKRGSTRSPDEPPVARLRGRWRHPGAVPHVAASILAETAEAKKKPPISLFAMALHQTDGTQR